MMWIMLPIEQKQKYKLLISNFASLSEAFSQKIDGFDTQTVAPIVNSKYQETVFQKAFGANSEDIANTSYDASVKLDDGQKYLVGIKSFGISAGDQKIAQFKSHSVAMDWHSLFAKIKQNADKVATKEEADNLNANLYKELAIKIAELRNIRIASSKAQVKGFDGAAKNVEAVYHVLMTSKKGDRPQIFVGETDYLPIDINTLQIEGSTSKNNPTNFKFTDGRHHYKYTSADSQLLMAFNNKAIICDTWDIEYIENPFYIFENLHKFTGIEAIVEDSVSWMLYDENHKLEESSGFNAFDGSTKLAKDQRQPRINQLNQKYHAILSSQELQEITQYLTNILIKKWSQSKEDITERKALRQQLTDYVKQIGNNELLADIEKLVYRSATEMYIPIPDSKNFHDTRPNFFGKAIGIFNTNQTSLALGKDKRKFRLEFIASGNAIEAYINQDLGKAIQSTTNQDILGKWILHEVFQLKEREPLTVKKLDELGINGIRLIKFKDHARGIGLDFIWIDPTNPPSDAIGWVAKNKIKQVDNE